MRRNVPLDPPPRKTAKKRTLAKQKGKEVHHQTELERSAKEFKGLSYLVGYNFSKCSILFKKNPRSGSYFILNDNKTLNKLNNQKIYLDVQSLEIIVKKIEDKTGVK